MWCACECDLRHRLTHLACLIPSVCPRSTGQESCFHRMLHLFVCTNCQPNEAGLALRCVVLWMVLGAPYWINSTLAGFDLGRAANQKQLSASSWVYWSSWKCELDNQIISIKFNWFIFVGSGFSCAWMPNSPKICKGQTWMENIGKHQKTSEDIERHQKTGS